MRKKILFLLVSALSVWPIMSYPDVFPQQDISLLVRFIVSEQMLTPNTYGELIPLSFYIGTKKEIALYFGDFICNPNNTCGVVDVIYKNPFAILGRGLEPAIGTELQWLEAQAQIERTNVKYGTDIYHAATWQIALALAAKNGLLPQEQARQLVANQLSTVMNPLFRATGFIFRYGGLKTIINPNFAFTYRWLAMNYYNKDPFFEGPYQFFLPKEFNLAKASTEDPAHYPPFFYDFITTWSDFKPLTGRNAWAQLIGPLQAEYLFTNGKFFISSPALINAMNSLYAFSLMQSAIGAFYFAPEGTQGIQSFIPRGTISIQDNLLVLAGLQILKRTLNATEQTPMVVESLRRIDVLLNGGTTLNGFKTKGLLSFLFNGAFDRQRGIFFTNGTALDPFSMRNWRPFDDNLFSFSAVTTNLWAISALGVENIDAWFGEGTALGIWSLVRENGGYINQNIFSGLGFSLLNNLGVSPEAMMSTEGTAAAINAVNSLISFYGDRSETLGLIEDLNTLENNIINLRNDRYPNEHFTKATPNEFFIRVPPSMGQAFLYASRHFPIPMDWSANTLASINANSWIIINNYKFNPFQFSGKLEGESYSIPEITTILDTDIETITGALPKALLVRFTARDLNFKRLAIRYNLDGSQTNWIIAVLTNEAEGSLTFPQGTKAISISLVNDGFENACEINPAIDLCSDDDCTNAKTIVANWSSSGRGNCELRS